MPGEVSPLDDRGFQEFLEALRVEQVMGATLHVSRVLPLSASVRLTRRSGVGNDPFIVALTQSGEGTHVLVKANTVNTEPLLRCGAQHLLSDAQTEALADTFGVPIIAPRFTQPLVALNTYSSLDDWWHACLTLLRAPQFGHLTPAQRQQTHEQVQRILTNRHRAGSLRRTSPDTLWPMFEEFLVQTPPGGPT